MPIFTAGAAAIATAIGFTAGTTGFIIAQSLIAAGLAAGTGHLLGVFDDDSGLPAVEDPGVEQRLGASTQNRVPILYGKFMQRGSLTYFEISEDRKTLYSVITLGEGPVTSIDEIYWDDIRVTLGAGGEVVSAVDVEGNATTRLNGNININIYRGLASNNSTYLEGLSTDWTSNHKMTGLVYAVVTVRYNRDADITGLNDLRIIGTAPINNPAEAVFDQLTNTRYGLGLDPSSTDPASFNAAITYYQEMLPYEDADGNTQMAERFQINGSINSGDPVFERIEAILLGSNSSLRWQDGKYSIFINKADTVEAFDMDESRVIGDISVSEVGLNSVVNQIEVQYGRDAANNYQRNTLTVTLPEANMYPNELRRVRSLNLPLVRTFVEAERIAYILLNQSREQLSIKHMATVEAMPLEAGDVITYTMPNYGWTGKEFRITRVSEVEEAGTLEYQIEAVEYAASVYTDRTHIEPGASPNSNIPAADELTAVTDLAIANRNDAAAQPNFELTWTSPQSSLVERFDVYVNNLLAPFDSDSTQFLHSVFPPGMRSSFNPAEPVSNVVYGLPAGSYNIWVVARNSFAASAESNTVELTTWDPRINNDGISAEIGDISIRLHENLATNDPGAPTGEEGIGGDWYDPSGQFGTIPDDPDPHWEARGVGAVTTAGLPRVADFALSGQGGLIQVNSTTQSYRFDVTGTPGARVQTGSAQQEITQFEITGDTTGGPTGGAQASWNLDFSGRSDSVATNINEEFYIYLDGNSGPNNVNGQYYIRPTGSTPSLDAGGFTRDYGSVASTASNDPPLNTARDGGHFIGIHRSEQDILELLHATVSTSTGVTSITTTVQTFTTDRSIDIQFGPAMYVADAGVTVTVEEDASFFGTARGVYIIRFFTANTGGTASDGQSYDLTVSAGSEPVSPSIGITIPQDNISTSITLGFGLTTDAELVSDAVTRLNEDSTITSNFTVSQINSSGISGLPDGTPLVVLTSDDFLTKTVTATFTDNNGDLSGSSFGVLTEPVNASASTVQIAIPTESIDRTLTLELGNTGATQLRNSLLTRIQADAVISGEFTVTAETSSGISGLANGLPIVKLTANDFLDHSISVTFTNHDGDLTGSQFGTIIEGGAERIPTEIRITYDNDLTPNMQDIVLGGVADGHGIADIVATAINGHDDLTAVSSETGESDIHDYLRTDSVEAMPEYAAGGGVQPVPFLDSNEFSFIYTNPSGTQIRAALQTSSGSLRVAFNSDLAAFFATGNLISLNWTTGSADYHIVYEVTGQGASVLTNPTAFVEVLGELPEGFNFFDNPVTVAGVLDPPTVTLSSYERESLPIGRVTVTTVESNVFTAPVLSIVERGTSDVFNQSVTVVSAGAEPTGDSSSYIIRRGGSIQLTGNFTNNIDADAAAMELQVAINGLAQYTATVSESIVTATSVANESTGITVTIDDGTGGNLNVSRTVTQDGSATDTFTGSDATASVRIGGSQIGSLITATGETNTDTAIAIAAVFNTDGRFTATVSTNTVTIEATFAGGTPDATIVVVPGTDPQGDTTDFAISRAVISDGLGDGTTSGTAASYAISVGGTNVANGNFLNGTSSAQAAITLSSALGSIDTYDGQSLAGSILRATSTFEGTSPDIVITIAAGTDADGSAGTLSVTKTVTQEGQFPGMDFTNTVWTYYVINQEVRVDDDTIDMMDDNTLQIRRGIIEDTQTWDDISNVAGPNSGNTADQNFAYLTESFTTSSRNTLGVFTINVLQSGGTVASATPVNLAFQLQYSTDNGATWTSGFTSFSFNIAVATAADEYRTVLPINFANTMTLSPSTTYWFRVARGFNDGTGPISTPSGSNISNFLTNMLLLEELMA